MFKFGGWKASLNFSGPSRRREVYDNGPNLSPGGAYRPHSEEFFARNSVSEPPKKLTPSMVKLPPSKESIKTSKSANDLTQHNSPPQLRQSSPDVSTDPRGGTSNNRDSSALYNNAKDKNGKDAKKESKEKKNAEKKRLAEQKKELKLAQEQAKQDKLRIQRDKKIAEQQAKDVNARKEKERKPQQTLPQATVAKSLVANAPVVPQRANPLARSQYSTNTLESSISRSSGPPPYDEPKPPEKQPNKRDGTGNTSFSKPIESSSWDMISEHRSQMGRTAGAGGARQKQVLMDLQLSFGQAQAGDANNSEV